jgi:hypothetical protein
MRQMPDLAPYMFAGLFVEISRDASEINLFNRALAMAFQQLVPE